MLTIFDWFNGSYPARVRIAVSELGFRNRVRFESVDLWRGEHKQPKCLAKNYSGTLHVLQVEDGSYIAECTAITMYLDSLGSKPLLTGTQRRKRASYT